MKLSVIIPAYNEEESLADTLKALYSSLAQATIDHEILVVDDQSTDTTFAILVDLQKSIPTLLPLQNEDGKGFGMAIRYGLKYYQGDCVCIMMADASDSPEDLLRFYQKMEKEQWDCVFGSRFVKGANVDSYPKIKLVLNRLANTLVKWVFQIDYNDCTNAFKLYKRQTIDGIMPLLAPHFNLTLEMPLKAIVRGYSYTVLSNNWTNRQHGKSNLKIKEMGSRYFFIFLYCLIEKYFSKGDYRKP